MIVLLRGLVWLSLVVEEVFPVVLSLVEQLADMSATNLLSTLVHSRLRSGVNTGTTQYLVGESYWIIDGLLPALLTTHVHFVFLLLALAKRRLGLGGCSFIV